MSHVIEHELLEKHGKHENSYKQKETEPVGHQSYRPLKGMTQFSLHVPHRSAVKSWHKVGGSWRAVTSQSEPAGGCVLSSGSLQVHFQLGSVPWEPVRLGSDSLVSQNSSQDSGWKSECNSSVSMVTALQRWALVNLRVEVTGINYGTFSTSQSTFLPLIPSTVGSAKLPKEQVLYCNYTAKVH